MSDHDHKAESKLAIKRLVENDAAGEGEHRALQAIANAEATLYAAEQQRIANMQVERGLLRQKSGRARGAEADNAAIEAHRLDVQIREGLGLL